MKKSYKEITDPHQFNLTRPELDDLAELLFFLTKASGYKIVHAIYSDEKGHSFRTYEMKKKSVIFPELRCPED